MENNKYLFIDSTLSGLAMAYWTNDGSKQRVFADQLSSHGLMTRIYKELINEDQVTHIVCAAGPGSFTGIRIGLAFAYGLVAASAGSIKIAGVSSLELGLKELKENLGADMVLWPSTKTHAYICAAKPEGFHTELISIADPGSFANQGLRCLCPKDWAGFSALGNTVKKEVSLEDFLKAAVHATQRLAPTLVYGHDIPQSNYLRKSTAEEKRNL